MENTSQKESSRNSITEQDGNTQTKNAKEKSESIIDKMVKAVPLGYAFIFFCGALHLHFYYNTFHIPIFKFLDLTEIATSFLPIIIVIIICMGSILCFLPIQIRLKSFFAKHKWNENNWLTIILCLGCAAYIYFSYLGLERNSASFHFSPYAKYLWIGFLTVSFFILLFTKKTPFIIANLTMIFMTAVVHESISDVHETINKAKSKSYIIITTDNDTIKTDPTYYFVSRTHNYIFLYSVKYDDYNAIPLSQVKRINLK
ncbi:MAG TPA: hypothetical protein VFJ43_07780 [Bacteroidia bacterium]|nr:hypothetical protein [Bacteroidia bacterium]